MSQKKHNTRAHAKLSASGASRWMSCTASIRLEDLSGIEDSSSKAADEGTLAHEFGELELRLATERITRSGYNKAIRKLRAHELYTSEMEGYVEKYTEFVLEAWNVSKQADPDTELLIEEKVSLEDYVPEGFGTCDVNVIGGSLVEVIDLKYGKGIKVDAEDNPQLKLYGLGALSAYDMMYDIETVRLTVVQPRLHHFSSWDISVEDLKKWGEGEVVPKAKEALSEEGKVKCGEWCRWCKAKPICEKSYEHAVHHACTDKESLKVAKEEQKEGLMSDEDMLKAYAEVPVILAWAKSVNSYMLSRALGGKKWQGLKLVVGKSNRKIEDEEKAIEILEEELYEGSQILNSKLKGIGDLEKLLGKTEFSAILGPVVTKPAGAPALVDESDPRPEFNSVESAKADFTAQF